jgi:hypothetical protein
VKGEQCNGREEVSRGEILHVIEGIGVRVDRKDGWELVCGRTRVHISQPQERPQKLSSVLVLQPRENFKRSANSAFNFLGAMIMMYPPGLW